MATETDDATLQSIRDYVSRCAAKKEKFIVESDRFGRPNDITTTEGYRLLSQHRQMFSEREMRVVMQVIYFLL